MGGRQIGALPAEQLEAVGAEPLGIALGREILDQAREAAEPVHAEHPAARHVDVAGERRQHRDGAYGLDAFRRVFDGAAPIQQGRLGLREQARGGADLIGGDPGDRLGPLRREFFHMRGELGEAVRPLRDERLVIEFLADDHIQHRKRERIVGARPDLQPEVRLFGEHRAARIDHDGPWIVRKRLHHIEARLAVRPRQHRVMTPKEDASRRHLAGVIAHREIAEGQNRGVHPRVEALGEARLAPIGGAERMAEARHPADMMAAGAGTERDGLRSVLFSNGKQAL